MGFEKYKDPEKAKKIYNGYLNELTSLGVGDRAQTAVEECNDSISLDVRLDIILTQLRQRLYAYHSNYVGQDIDSDGWYSNSRRVYEGD